MLLARVVKVTVFQRKFRGSFALCSDIQRWPCNCRQFSFPDRGVPSHTEILRFHKRWLLSDLIASKTVEHFRATSLFPLLLFSLSGLQMTNTDCSASVPPVLNDPIYSRPLPCFNAALVQHPSVKSVISQIWRRNYIASYGILLFFSLTLDGHENDIKYGCFR